MISSKYKDLHLNKTAVLFGTGPTLELFSFPEACGIDNHTHDLRTTSVSTTKIPKILKGQSLIFEAEEDLVKVGVNSIVYKKNWDGTPLSVDYYFCVHNVARESYRHPHRDIEEGNPLFKKILKTIKRPVDKVAQRYWEERVGKYKNVMRVFVASKKGFEHIPDADEFFTKREIEEMGADTFEITHHRGGDFFQKDITAGPLYNHSIIFPALQFLLYTGVNKIYVIGCDCGGGNSYLVRDKPWADQYARDEIGVMWSEFMDFKRALYPEVKMVAVNPVGLRNFFDEDVYVNKEDLPDSIRKKSNFTPPEETSS